jgi:hypothetical protein
VVWGWEDGLGSIVVVGTSLVLLVTTRIGAAVMVSVVPDSAWTVLTILDTTALVLKKKEIETY